MQFVVAAPFTILICIQIGVAWVIRRFAQPKALTKTQAARREQQRQTAAVGHSADDLLQETHINHAEGTAGPRHVFPDPEEGEQLPVCTVLV